MTVEDQIRALADLDYKGLVARYEELVGKPLRQRNAPFLRKRIAYAIQEREYGGLSNAARRRIEALAAEIKLPLGEVRVPRRSDKIQPGTVLRRVWKGMEQCVLVHAEGYEWNGTIYGSLSAAANAITGSRWNGKLFFGLTKGTKTS
ncbi:MAG: DUF2924 domain-containing protein [Planctomycetes bacterium]|nr:DUF2924 domain-containing protein [Planctomycetota bacterium]